MNKENRTKISTGIFIIGLGILFLLNTMGYINQFNWNLLFHLWPLLIILVGLNLILKHTPLWWMTNIIFFLGIIALFLVSSDIGYNYDYNFYYSSNGSEYKQYQTEQEMEEGIERLELFLESSAGRLSFDSVKNTENLYEISSVYRNIPPEIMYRVEGETGYLNIFQNLEKDLNLFSNRRRNTWDLNLTPLVPVSLEINIGAGSFHFNLQEIIIEKLTINSGACDLEVNLGNQVEYVEINSGVMNLELKIPENRAVSIMTKGVISNKNFNRKGLFKTADNTYQTPGFEDADQKLIIEIRAPISNIELDFYRVD